MDNHLASTPRLHTLSEKTSNMAPVPFQQQPTNAVIQQYRELMAESQKVQAKISELEMDRNEHLLVEETLKPLEPTRRAYRLVGECLVERTVQEVLPTVTSNRENMEKTIKALKERLEQQQNQVAEIKANYNFPDAQAS